MLLKSSEDKRKEKDKLSMSPWKLKPQSQKVKRGDTELDFQGFESYG